MQIEILTTAHWPGDPRLNRHIVHLVAAGHRVTLRSAHDRSRFAGVAIMLVAAIRTNADVVVFPDPEMFVVGSAAARLRRKKPVIDIHENYVLSVAGRTWVPKWARPFVSVAAWVAVRLGRLLAWRIVVAAPELAREGDFEVLNIPPPSSFPAAKSEPRDQVVYVGDVTVARGADEMARLALLLPQNIELLVIGRVSPDAERIFNEPSSAEHITVTGQLTHEDAWKRAAGSIAGLCLLQPLPAYRDAVATKIWEYMAAGIPPVVSDLPGQRRVVEQIHADLVGSSLEDIATTIAKLIEDPEFRAETSRMARALCQHAWENSRPDLAIQEAVAP